MKNNLLAKVYHKLFPNFPKAIRWRMIKSGNLYSLFSKTLYDAFIPSSAFKDIDYNNKIVLFVLAGRQDRMSILVSYLEKLILEEMVDYVHIWNFARNREDFEWVRGLREKNGKIIVLSPTEFTDLTGYYGHQYELFKAAYHFYSQPIFRNSYLVKCDDDIVYLNIDNGAFQGFLSSIKNLDSVSPYYLISANVINNGICANIQQKIYGLIPEKISNYYYPNDKIKGGASELYWRKGVRSQALHEYFLNNHEEFVALSNLYELQEVNMGDRFSINFIGFRQNVASEFISSGALDDEQFLTVELAKKLQKKVAVYMPLVVSHLSYASQAKYQNDSLLLEKYRKMI